MKKHKSKDHHKTSHYSSDEEYDSKKDEKKNKSKSREKYEKEDYSYKSHKKKNHKHTLDDSSSGSDTKYKCNAMRNRKDDTETRTTWKGGENSGRRPSDGKIAQKSNSTGNFCDSSGEEINRYKDKDFINKRDKRKIDTNFEAESSSHSTNYYSRKHEKRKDTESSEEDSDFTYLKYKHDLNRILLNFNLIQNTEEFWTFVKKYESLEKKVKKQKKNTSTSLNSIGVPEVYDKSHCMNFLINYSSRELFMRVQEIRELTDAKLRKFKEIVTNYIDFKQKEKFQKLKKLRTEQANLPVAQYRDEIISSVKNERVVIIAGDTGCGKSTQVPQYLYEAGLGRIGKN